MEHPIAGSDPSKVKAVTPPEGILYGKMADGRFVLAVLVLVKRLCIGMI